MTSRQVTLRADSDLIERLDSESKRQGMTRAELARALVEEGLRMQSHPGIVFRPGPTGRRAALAAGPDVWEVARVFRDLPPDDKLIARTAKACGLSLAEVRVAMGYYRQFQPEVDERIALADEATACAEAELPHFPSAEPPAESV